MPCVSWHRGMTVPVQRVREELCRGRGSIFSCERRLGLWLDNSMERNLYLKKKGFLKLSKSDKMFLE